MIRNFANGLLPETDGNRGTKDVFYIPRETVMVQMSGDRKNTVTEKTLKLGHEVVPR